MATQTGARIVGGEAEWFGRRSIHYLEDVDAHSISDNFHFVDQADVHSSVNILQQLCHLSGLGRANRHNLIYCLFIERDTNLQTISSVPTDNLRNSTSLEVWITRVFAFW